MYRFFLVNKTFVFICLGVLVFSYCLKWMTLNCRWKERGKVPVSSARNFNELSNGNGQLIWQGAITVNHREEANIVKPAFSKVSMCTQADVLGFPGRRYSPYCSVNFWAVNFLCLSSPLWRSCSDDLGCTWNADRLQLNGCATHSRNTVLCVREKNRLFNKLLIKMKNNLPKGKCTLPSSLWWSTV